MSGLRRLSIFLTGVWAIGWLALYSTDPFFNWTAYFPVGICPPALVWGLWWVRSGFANSPSYSKTFTNGLLAAGAVLLGITTAALQGFSGAEFAGASLVPVFFGLFVAGARKPFRRGPTNMFKWMLGWAVVAFIIEILSGI